MFKMKKNNNWAKGFSLIELLVVIAIIGILAAGGGVYYSQARKQSRDLKRQSDLAAIQSALELYYSDNKSYPAGYNNTALKVLTSEGYLTQLPKDPEGTDYFYNQPITGSSDINCNGLYALYTKVEISKNVNVSSQPCKSVSGQYFVLMGGK